MGNLTSSLTVKLIDDVTGPAHKVANALKEAEARARAMGKALEKGVSPQFAKGLEKAGLSAPKIEAAADAWRDYAKSIGLSGDRSKWRREDITKMRAWEQTHVDALRNVRRETEALTAQRQRAETTALAGAQSRAARIAQRSAAEEAPAIRRAPSSRERVSSRVRGALPTGGLGGGVVGGLVGGYTAIDGYKKAAAFDRRLTMIGQTADATRPQIDALGAALFDLARTTATPVDSLTGGLEALVAQGKSLKEAMAILPAVAMTATATGAEVDDIGKSADAVGTHLKVTAKEMQAAFDIMAAGGKAGQFELKDMARYLPSMAASAKAVGLEGTKGLSDLVAMLQVIRKGSGSAEEAATSMNNVLAKMESEETTKKFKKMGVDLEAAMKKGRKEGRNLIEVLEEASNKALKGDLSKIPQLFSDMEFARGMRALLSMKGEWQKLSKSIATTSAGTVGRDFAGVAKDAQAAINNLESAWKRFQVGAAKFADSAGLSDLLGKDADTFERLAKAIERAKDAYKAAGSVGLLKMAAREWAEEVEREGEAAGQARHDDRRAEQAGKLIELEKRYEEARKNLEKSGMGPEFVEIRLGKLKKELETARTALADLDAKKEADAAAKAQKNPPAPSMTWKPEDQPLVPPGPGQPSFAEAYPLNPPDYKAPPATAPVPPTRPGDVPRTIDSLDDVTAKPKVDTSEVDGVSEKAQIAAAKMKAALEPAVSVTVDSSSVDTLISKLMRALGLKAQLESGGGSGKVGSALSGSFTD